MDFVLELTNVASLTEARFAAGEGFTHIRFNKDFYHNERALVESIRAFLSGVQVGLDGIEAPELDYQVVKQDYQLYLESATGVALPIGTDLDEPYILAYKHEDTILLQAFMQNPKVVGVSLPSIPESKTGFMDTDTLQALVVVVRERFEQLG